MSTGYLYRVDQVDRQTSLRDRQSETGRHQKSEMFYPNSEDSQTAKTDRHTVYMTSFVSLKYLPPTNTVQKGPECFLSIHSHVIDSHCKLLENQKVIVNPNNPSEFIFSLQYQQYQG